MDDLLHECEYCGGVRLFDATASCPGCGAPMKKPKAKKKKPKQDKGAYRNNADWFNEVYDQQAGWEDLQRGNYTQLYRNQMSQMQNAGMQQSYQGMLGMEQAFMFGRPSSSRRGGGK
jgi:hypothetical protein